MTEFTLKQIEVFVKVAETKSFTRAAQDLYLTQSTVSAHIASLEDTLQTKLLMRQAKRQVILTPDGEKLYPQAKKILGECEFLQDLIKKKEDTLPLQLGASTVPGQYILPALMGKYLKKNPTCRYLIRRGDSAAIHQMLLEGSVRIGFVGAMLDPHNMEYVSVAEDNLVMVTPNTEYYQNFKMQGILGKDLLGEPTIARELGSGTERAVQGFMAKIGYAQNQLDIVARVEEPETIKNMIIHGMGVSILSHLAVEEEEKAGKLLVFDLNTEKVKRDVYLVYRKGNIFKQNEQEFLKFASKHHK